MDSNELLQQIAKDIGTMKEQMASMQEQLNRIEQGQKLLAGDVFDHKVRLLGIEGRKAK